MNKYLILLIAFILGIVGIGLHNIEVGLILYYGTLIYGERK